MDGTGVDAVLRQVRIGLGVQFAGIEQRLAGYAADVEAGAAQGGAFFDAGHAHAQLGRPDRRYVTSRTCTNHQHIVTLGHVRSVVSPAVATDITLSLVVGCLPCFSSRERDSSFRETINRLAAKRNLV